MIAEIYLGAQHRNAQDKQLIWTQASDLLDVRVQCQYALLRSIVTHAGCKTWHCPDGGHVAKGRGGFGVHIVRHWLQSLCAPTPLPVGP